MATVELDVFSSAGFSPGITESKSKHKRFHRIQEVRRRQGVSLRSAARQLGTDVRSVRAQENGDADLRISDLHKWQQALDVPIAELLVESDESLSGPVLERARMIRLMKTAAAIRERAPNTSISRMAEMLVGQLCEIMPELSEVGPWHNVGQRRSADEYGRVVERRLADDSFCCEFGGGDDD
jgi:transcriptional regulator with XRE-family HTH domain